MAEKGALFADQPPLAPADLEEILEALIHSYSVKDLDRLTGFRMGFRISIEIGSVNGAARAMFGDLLDWTEQSARTRDLLALAWSEKPQNPLLATAAAKFLPNPAAALAAYGRNELPPPPPSLQAMVSTRSTLVDFDAFLQRFEKIRTGICRIETSATLGTGFLIDERTVLTNYHVVRAEIATPPLAEAIVCRFDFHGGAAGTTVQLAVGGPPIGLRSSYAQSDLSGTGAPAPGELDFAILNLAQPVGAERQCWPLPDRATAVLPGDVALVAQHAAGEDLKVALGSIVEFPASGLRYRYNCTTNEGSSGGPVFDANLDLIGLHHAADPANHPAYNQAIPAYLIGRAIGAGKA